MGENNSRQFLDFEKPIKDLYDQIDQIKLTAEKNKIDLSDSVRQLEEKILDKKKEITQNLTSWQKVQLSRHPDRPYTLSYIERICTDFVELHGDRNYKDDKAIVGGFGKIDGNTVMILGQQKGSNTKTRQLRNFGMANPEGYRKALRLMKLAEKFNKPVITLVDTPGAFPGIEAEERGQGEAIAKNIFEMLRLKVPVICVIIGEGASGGAMGIGVGDKVYMMENTWYSVISPESCSSILWKSWEYKEQAAESLKLTSTDMKKMKLVDDVIPEPLGGAHYDKETAFKTVEQYIMKAFNELKDLSTVDLVAQRMDKYSKMGEYKE
jgi:acetyl-CoA carboxylase carboxyl transferase subunit alpha